MTHATLCTSTVLGRARGNLSARSGIMRSRGNFLNSCTRICGLDHFQKLFDLSKEIIAKLAETHKFSEVRVFLVVKISDGQYCPRIRTEPLLETCLITKLP